MPRQVFKHIGNKYFIVGSFFMKKHRHSWLAVLVIGLFFILSLPMAASGQTAPAANVNPEITAGITEAVNAFNASKFSESLQILTKLYQKHKELAPPRIVMAQWFATAEFGDAVRATLEMAVEETPDDPESYLLLGEIALRQRHLTAAELLFQRGREKLNRYTVNPERKKIMESSYLRNLVSLSESRGRWTAMEDAINKKIQLDGESSVLLRQKGVALFQQKKDNEARNLFVRADRLDVNAEQKGLPAEAAMSQLYLLRGDRDNARKSLAEALAKNPKSREVLVLSIQMRISDDQLEEARRLSQNLLAEDPKSESVKRLQATIALYLSDYAGAEKLFQEMVTADANDHQAVNGLALALCEQNNRDKLRRAVEYAKKNLARFPDNSEYAGTLGWALLRNNQTEEATQALRQSAASGQVSAATAYYFAYLANQTGKKDEAKKLLEAAVSSSSPFAKKRDAVRMLRDLNK
jgi:predicted Zn-dependent protease